MDTLSEELQACGNCEHGTASCYGRKYNRACASWCESAESKIARAVKIIRELRERVTELEKEIEFDPRRTAADVVDAAMEYAPWCVDADCEQCETIACRGTRLKNAVERMGRC